MLSTPPVKDAPEQPAAVIDPEIILAGRTDRLPPPGPETARRVAERAAARPPETPVPPVDTSLRVSNSEAQDEPAERSAIATWAIRTAMAILFAVASAVGAAAWQTYGDQAQAIAARWIPHISLISSASGDKPAPDASATPTAASQGASAETTAAPSVPAASSPAPAAAAQASAEQSQVLQSQVLQSMAHDLAAVGQQISDLKASIAQLKSGQDQMAREIARLSEARAERTPESRAFDPKAIEQTLRPRPAAPRPATAAAGTVPAPVPHRPRPAPAVQSAAPAAAPMPLPSAAPPTDAEGGGVVRPPMPVR